MKLVIKQFFTALSELLDHLESSKHLETDNHCKRVCALSLAIADKLGFAKKDLFTLGMLALVHNIGMTIYDKDGAESETDSEDHCYLGAEIVKNIPCLSNYSDAILLQNRSYTSIVNRDIDPESLLFSQILHIGHALEYEITESKSGVSGFKKKYNPLDFHDKVYAAATSLNTEQIRINIAADNIDTYLDLMLQDEQIEILDFDILELTSVFSMAVDMMSKSNKKHSLSLVEKTSIMSKYYNFDSEKTLKMTIAASLHDIGTLAVFRPEGLDMGSHMEERNSPFHKHPIYTNKMISKIDGWDEIGIWASDHHEKLNGSGSPKGKNALELSFESRIIAALELFQEICEDCESLVNPDCERVFKCFELFVWSNEIDGRIFNDIKALFYDNSKNFFFNHDVILKKRDRDNVKLKKNRNMFFDLLKNASASCVYESLFMKSKSIMLVIDPENGRIIDANASASVFYDYTKDEFQKLRIMDINQLPPDKVRHYMNKAVVLHKNNFIFEHRLKSGEIAKVQVSSIPIEFGGINLLFSVINKISSKLNADGSTRIDGYDSQLLVECAYCDKIQDNKGNWSSPKDFILERMNIYGVSHGICPECYKRAFRRIMEKEE